MNTEEAIKAVRSAPIIFVPKKMEHKTVCESFVTEYDTMLNQLEGEGWRVDLKFVMNTYLCAFLSREVPSSPPTFYEVKMTHNFRRAMIEIANARSLVSSTDFTQEDRNRLILTQLQNVEAHVREMCDSLEKTASGGESNH